MLKVFYAGSPEPSAAVLRSLVENAKGFEVVGVLTNPPSAKKRSKELTATAVADVASSLEIPVFTPEHLDSAFRAQIEGLNADIFVCFDYGHIFGPKFLSMFALGGINLHPSLLPKYRGCTPVPAAILSGDEKTGVSLQKISLEIDSGDILDCREITLSGTETTESLMAADGVVVKNGIEMISSLLEKIASSGSNGAFTLPEGKKQEGEASYTPFIEKSDGKIDWNESASVIERKIRAFTPYPLCFSSFNDIRVTILKAKVGEGSSSEKAGTVLPYRKSVGIEIACGDGSILVVSELQQEKKKAMDYKSFLNGARNFVGSILG